MVFQPGVFQPGVFQGAEGEPIGTLDAVFAPAFVAVFTGTPIVTGAMDATFAPAFEVEITGDLPITGTLSATFAPVFQAAFTGDSEGTIIVIPRDATNGIAYLVELGAYDLTGDAETVLRYSSDGFNTTPSDTPANAHFAPHLKVPGDYERNLFGSGGTAGDIEVGAGVVDLVNVDGSLDALLDYAFDGYEITIRTVDRIGPVYADAVTVFRGTMSQAEFTWGRVRLLIRDRLAALDQPIQTELFAGTTISGELEEAEGQPDDLKGQPKPLAFGAVRQIEAIPSNVYDGIYSLGQNGLDDVAEVRDGGVLLTQGSDYATVAALANASITSGQYGTCLDAGLIRPGGAVVKTLTAAPVKGATAADRTAAQLAKLVMERMGLVQGADFVADDITALDAANDAEIGYWIGAEERTGLKAVSDILGSIGATCVPNRLGVFRLYRFETIPVDEIPVATFTTAEIIEKAGSGIERRPTGDQGNGIPAWRVNVRYGWNGAVMSRSDLDVAATESYKAFTGEEWRTATAEDEAVKTAHRLSPDLTFDTYLIHEADAQAEATRRLALYGVRRDRFLVPVEAFLAEQIDLNAVIRLRFDRFGLSEGKLFRVIGMRENFQTGVTTLDCWG